MQGRLWWVLGACPGLACPAAAEQGVPHRRHLAACGLALQLALAPCSLAKQVDEAYAVTQHYLRTSEPAGGAGRNRTFAIASDRFVQDGRPVRLVTGEMHYFRIHPAHWLDRLARAKSLGLNAIQIYVPWNLHNPFPSVYKWDGVADVERFILLAQKLGLLVLLRPGPYICAEWDFGGFPWWFGDTEVAGGAVMKYRTNDPAYLKHVDKWWGVLLGRLEPLLYHNGGPIAMVQVENEFGFIGPDRDYMQHLVKTARASLGPEVILYTVDPPSVAAKGGPDDGSVYATVDFGPGWYALDDAFGAQKAQNAPGMSPPYCAEYYTGWLSYNTLPVQNTSLGPIVDWLDKILRYDGGWGSVSLYMAVGGTNFGFSPGAQNDPPSPPDTKIHWREGRREERKWYKSVTTSYDYSSPISEAGDYGQPGLDGPNRFEAIRAVILNNTGVDPSQLPVVPRPAIRAYGGATLTQAASLLGQLPYLFPSSPIASQQALPMEEFGLQSGFILYRTTIDMADAYNGSQLYLGTVVHDYAHVLVNGQLVGQMDRNGAQNLALSGLPASEDAPTAGTVTGRLEVLVAALGRTNTGRQYDLKGLVDTLVVLNGKALSGWEVFPLGLSNIDSLCLPAAAANATAPAAAAGCPAAAPQQLCTKAPPPKAVSPSVDGPTFYRGTFSIDPELVLEGSNSLPDTYLSMAGWGKGLAFVNGFNLGWYWVSRGPSNTMYVPGPVLKPCGNEIVILEVDALALPQAPSVRFVGVPNFYGPRPPNGSAEAEADRFAAGAQHTRAEGVLRGAHLWPVDSS